MGAAAASSQMNQNARPHGITGTGQKSWSCKRSLKFTDLRQLRLGFIFDNFGWRLHASGCQPPDAAHPRRDSKSSKSSIRIRMTKSQVPPRCMRLHENDQLQHLCVWVVGGVRGHGRVIGYDAGPHDNAAWWTMTCVGLYRSHTQAKHVVRSTVPQLVTVPCM